MSGAARTRPPARILGLNGALTITVTAGASQEIALLTLALLTSYGTV